jgi:hypothetical protein
MISIVFCSKKSKKKIDETNGEEGVGLIEVELINKKKI